MKIKIKAGYSVWALGIILLFQGLGTEAYAKEAAFNAFVSIVPQRYFLEKLCGELVHISVMVRPGANPATYEPKPRQMVVLAKSKIYFAVGVPFEKVWLKKVAGTNPDIPIIHTEKGIEKLPMASDPYIWMEASHQDRQTPNRRRGTDDGGIKDPHIWLSPPLVAIQARNMMQGLVQVDPDHKDAYRTNYQAFINELARLDQRIREIFSGKQGLKFMVYHPAWGYFAEAYGLKQIPVEVEGKSPGPRELHNMIDWAKKEGVRTIFAQPQFSKKNAETIARAIGGKVIFADPLAYDWEKNLLEVAQKFERALR